MRMTTAKFLSDVVCVVFFVVSAGPAHGADRFRAQFQVSVDDGGNLQTARTASEMASGMPIEYDLKGYALSLMIDVSESNEYTLTVAVLPPGTLDAVVGKFDGRLVGSESGPLEFETEQGGIRIWGAIAVTRID